MSPSDNVDRVIISLLIGLDGLKDSKVTQSSGSPQVDEAIRAALSVCKMQPLMIDGVPVHEATWVNVVVWNDETWVKGRVKPDEPIAFPTFKVDDVDDAQRQVNTKCSGTPCLHLQ